MVKFQLYLLCILCPLIVFGQNEVSFEEGINGISFVSGKDSISIADVEPLKGVNATWVSVIPFAFMPNKSKPILTFDNEWQWYGERLDGAKQMIQKMHAEKLKVMLKPQVWVGMGDYTGFIDMETEEEWLILEKGYEAFILAYVDLAKKEEVEMICIGTEMSVFAKKRSSFWRSLIDKIRLRYNGKLTYAENWDAFHAVDFWDALDFVGVDAYFPIKYRGRPKLNELIEGWKVHEELMDSVSTKFDKKILFTEYGYRSIENCASEPWNYNKRDKIDEQAQYDALNALFHVCWSKENFAGGFLWKWWPSHDNAGGFNDGTFTVQNKLSESLVRDIYGR